MIKTLIGIGIESTAAYLLFGPIGLAVLFTVYLMGAAYK